MEIVDRIEGIFSVCDKQFSELKKELKCLKKSLEKPKESKMTGFASSTQTVLSSELCEFLSLPEKSELSRREVFSKIHLYISNNNLQDPSDHRNILLDDKLEKLFGNSEARKQTISARKLRKPTIKSEVTDKVHYFNLQIHISRHV